MAKMTTLERKSFDRRMFLVSKLNGKDYGSYKELLHMPLHQLESLNINRLCQKGRFIEKPTDSLDHVRFTPVESYESGAR